MNGLPRLIEGDEEIAQQMYILLSAKKGGFIYDRSLGSELYAVDMNRDDCIEQLEAKARQALAGLRGAEVVGIMTDSGNVTITVESGGKLFEIPVRIGQGG